MANFTGRNVSFHWCCPFVLVSGVRRSVRGHRHLTIKVDTWVAFKSDYCGQEVRMFPEELWDLSIVPLNYFSQTGWNLFAELLLSFRKGCAGHGAEMLQQDRACFFFVCRILPLSILYGATAHWDVRSYCQLGLKSCLSWGTPPV